MSTSQREKSCKERIQGEYEGRLKQIQALMKGMQVNDQEDLAKLEIEELQEILNVGGFKNEQNEWVPAIRFNSETDRFEEYGTSAWEEITPDRVREEAGERLNELPLGVSVRKVMRVELSWGGPQDYFEVEIEDGQVAGKVEYHFLDWFDGAEITVDDSEVEDFMNYFAETASLEDERR